jgi:hypothetical protein
MCYPHNSQKVQKTKQATSEFIINNLLLIIQLYIPWEGEGAPTRKLVRQIILEIDSLTM